MQGKSSWSGILRGAPTCFEHRFMLIGLERDYDRNHFLGTSFTRKRRLEAAGTALSRLRFRDLLEQEAVTKLECMGGGEGNGYFLTRPFVIKPRARLDRRTKHVSQLKMSLQR